MMGPASFMLMIPIAQTEAPDVEQAKEMGLQTIDRFKEFAERIMSGDYLGFIIGGCFLSLIIVGSGALSSSIAEGRLRSRNLHFLLGMLLPVIYPLVAFFALPRKVYEKDEAKEMRLIGKEEEEAESEFDMQSALNYDFFHAAMFDEAGNPRGPFMMLVDSVELRVERIAEVMPTVVVLETVNADGNLQTMRLPFSRISACREF
jgi:hypothetical protein